MRVSPARCNLASAAAALLLSLHLLCGAASNCRDASAYARRYDADDDGDGDPAYHVYVWSALHKGGSSVLSNHMSKWCSAIGASAVASHNQRAHDPRSATAGCRTKWLQVPDRTRVRNRPESGPDPDLLIDSLLAEWEGSSNNSNSKKKKKTKAKRVGCVGVVRNFNDLPPRPNVVYHHLVMLRDPRDIVVSGYFSFGWTHNMANPTFAQNKDGIAIRALNASAYALSDLVGSGKFIEPRFRPLLVDRRPGSSRGSDGGGEGRAGGYETALATRGGASSAASSASAASAPPLPYRRVVVTYDQMVLSPRTFAERIAGAFLELPDPAGAAEALLPVLPAPPTAAFGGGAGARDGGGAGASKEQRGAKERLEHIRAVVPGNYRLHLDRGTVKALSRRFKGVLALHHAAGGFQLEPYAAHEPPAALEREVAGLTKWGNVDLGP